MAVGKGETWGTGDSGLCAQVSILMTRQGEAGQKETQQSVLIILVFLIRFVIK